MTDYVSFLCQYFHLKMGSNQVFNNNGDLSVSFQSGLQCHVFNQNGTVFISPCFVPSTIISLVLFTFDFCSHTTSEIPALRFQTRRTNTQTHTHTVFYVTGAHSPRKMRVEWNVETAAPCDAPVTMTQLIETGANENKLIENLNKLWGKEMVSVLMDT